jgi:hypothetical protein
MFSAQADESGKYPQMRRSNNWAPGVSGNPNGGRLLVERNAALKARAVEIFNEALADLGPLTGLETSLVRGAAQSLAAAELQTTRAETRARLLTGAHRVIEKVRENIRQRERTKPQPFRSWSEMLDEAGASNGD